MHTPSSLLENKQIEAKAYFAGSRIDLKPIPNISPTNSRAYKVSLGDDACAYVYKYGSIIFYNTPDDKISSFLKKYTPSSETDLDRKISETVTINITTDKDNAVFFDKINIKSRSEELLLIISDILAKSVFLDYYEKKVIDIFNILDPISNNLQLGKYPSKKNMQLYLKHIGTTFNIQRSFAGQVGIQEKPELLWEQPLEINNFFSRMEDEYDIIERYDALKEKLDIIRQTSETMLELTQTKQSLRVEWYIVFLIVFEIVISLTEKFL